MMACAAARAGGYGRREIVIRVNGLATPWGGADLAGVAGSGADAVLLPKVGGRRERARGAARLAARRARSRRRCGACWRRRAASCARGHRRGQPARGRAGHGHVRPDEGSPRAAHARPPSAADEPRPLRAGRARPRPGGPRRRPPRPRRRGRFRAACRQARDMGFDGKTLIHPRRSPSPTRSSRRAGGDRLGAQGDGRPRRRPPRRARAWSSSTAAWSRTSTSRKPAVAGAGRSDRRA